jgi:hypothetical protein
MKNADGGRNLGLSPISGEFRVDPAQRQVSMRNGMAQ